MWIDDVIAHLVLDMGRFSGDLEVCEILLHRRV
jgi:hypothetical protein